MKARPSREVMTMHGVSANLLHGFEQFKAHSRTALR